jgi:hypothetical protein
MATRKTFFIPADAASGAKRLSVAVYDIKGRPVAHEYTGAATGKNQEIVYNFDRSKVSPGVYCITVRYGERIFSGRLNVQ